MIISSTNNYSIDLKLSIIQLYCKNKYSVTQLSSMFDISKSSIYDWINKYNNNLKYFLTKKLLNHKHQ